MSNNEPNPRNPRRQDPIELLRPLSDIELQVYAADLCDLGARVTYEALKELNQGNSLPYVLRRYAWLNQPQFLDILNELDGRRLYL